MIFPVIAIAGTRIAFGDAKARSTSIGFVCATLNVIMYGSPLSAIVSLSSLFYFDQTIYYTTNDNKFSWLLYKHVIFYSSIQQ